MIQQDISIYLNFKSTYTLSSDQEQNNSKSTLIVSETEPNETQIDEIMSIASEDHDHNAMKIAKGEVIRKNRKVRTTITKEKLELMNIAFAQYSAHQKDPNSIYNLKRIAQQLGFSYSTILHKFREFRVTKKVKGGALIASLQKKRKYRKSLQIEHIIEKALTQRPFRTAVELSKYILCTFERSYSRSTVSRHLGQMGYSLKNIKQGYFINGNRANYIDQIQTCTQSIAPTVCDQRDRNVIYIDEMTCPLAHFIRRINIDGIYEQEAITESQEYVSVLIAARCEQIIYFEIDEGFISRNSFCNSLINIRKKMNQINKYDTLGEQTPLVIINNLDNNIYWDSPQSDHKIIRQTLMHLNMRQYFLPFSFQLNPLEKMFLNINNQHDRNCFYSKNEFYMSLISYMQELQKQAFQIHLKKFPYLPQQSLKQQLF